MTDCRLHKPQSPGFWEAESLAAILQPQPALRPFAVDVGSGAETDGKKDEEKIKYLVKYTHEMRG